MGQYYVIANLDKREFLNPRAFLSGQKLMEFSRDRNGVMMGLAVLLASSNGMGGGDLKVPAGSLNDYIPGHWAGDRIVVAGDYDEEPTSLGFRIYDECTAPSSPLKELASAVDPAVSIFRNISFEVLGCLLGDASFREDFCKIEVEASEAWHVYMKAQRRNQWKAARPNDPVPESLR
jgi:hypothetical protein